MKKITYSRILSIVLVLSVGLNLWQWQQTREVSAEKIRALETNIAGGRSFLIEGKGEIKNLLNGSQSQAKEQKSVQLQLLRKDVYSAWQMFGQLPSLDSPHSTQWGKVANSLFLAFESLSRMQGEVEKSGTFSEDSRAKMQAVYDYLNVLHEGFDAELTPSIRETGYLKSPSIERAYQAAVDFERKIVK